MRSWGVMAESEVPHKSESLVLRHRRTGRAVSFASFVVLDIWFRAKAGLGFPRLLRLCQLDFPCADDVCLPQNYSCTGWTFSEWVGKFGGTGRLGNLPHDGGKSRAASECDRIETWNLWESLRIFGFL